LIVNTVIMSFKRHLYMMD